MLDLHPHRLALAQVSRLVFLKDGIFNYLIFNYLLCSKKTLPFYFRLLIDRSIEGTFPNLPPLIPMGRLINSLRNNVSSQKISLKRYTCTKDAQRIIHLRRFCNCIYHEFTLLLEAFLKKRKENQGEREAERKVCTNCFSSL